MNRKFAIIISIATVLLVGLLIALSVFRSSPQSSDQATITEVVIPTGSPNNQSFTSTSSNIKSNDDIQLDSADTSAVDNTVKKLPIDTAEFKVEYSDLLDTFYVQSTATDAAQLNQFLEENNLANLYKSHPKFFKFTKQYPKDVMDEDEFTFIEEQGLSEFSQKITETPQETRLAPLKSILKSFTAFDFPKPTGVVLTAPQPIGGGEIAQANESAQPAGSSINTANCASIVGNEKIVCAALKYTGIRYGFGGNAAKSTARWGVRSRGSEGHSPAQWIASRTPNGPTDFLQCSGYTAVAIYEAFGVVADHYSTAYYGATYFKKIGVDAARAGDFLIKGTGAASQGGGGHIGIFVKRLANGRIQTLESTPRGTGRSGYYEVSPTFFDRAVRYTGPGSTP